MPTLDPQLEAYFACIGLPPMMPEPNLATLHEIVQHHLFTFFYQNTALYQEARKLPEKRQVPSLEASELFKQFVTKRQAGYCFQNLELLACVLRCCGFQLEKHVARVINRTITELDQETVRNAAFSHEVLIVSIDGQQHLVDTGFSQNSLRSPMPFKFSEQYNAGELVRLVEVEGDWRVDFYIADAWFCLYQIYPHPCDDHKIAELHKQLYFSEKFIPIRDKFIQLALVNSKKRKQLVIYADNSGFFKSYRKDMPHHTKTKEFTTREVGIEIAQEKFSITLTI